MAAVCYGIIEYDDDIYNYDRDTEQWKIMQKRLEDIGMMTRQEFATAYREVTASAGSSISENLRSSRSGLLGSLLSIFGHVITSFYEIDNAI